MQTGFRRDVEGLRAVAVTLVVLYHANWPVLTGGFVGVDVFFVISGFVITRMLVAELEDRGTISLAGFYARRARRLLPASTVVLVATLGLAYLLLPPLLTSDVASTARWVVLYAVNIDFAASGLDYNAPTDPSPLLHYWSLAVEEQFYLVWPLLLIGAWAAGARTRARLAAIAAVLGIASLALSWWWTDRSQPLAFFLLPSRAWELAAGAAVALLAARLATGPKAALGVLGWAGGGAILLAAVAYDDTTAFPGLAAVLPVAGTAAVIACGCAAPRLGPAVLLERGPLQWLGARSYTWYLWHWPLLIIPAAASTTAPTRTGNTILALVALALAAATTRLVERPVRRSVTLTRRPRVGFALGGTLMALAAATTAGVAIATPLSGTGAVAARPAAADPGTAPPARAIPSNLRPGLREARADVGPIYDRGCHLDFLDDRPRTCRSGARAPAAPEVVLFGDSHAAQWHPPLEAAATREGWRLASHTKSSCPSVDVTVRVVQLNRAYAECDAWRAAVLRRIRRERPAVVVLTNSSAYSRPDGIAVTSAEWEAGLERTLKAIGKASRVVVLADTPRFARDPAVCASEHVGDATACSTALAAALATRRHAPERRAAARAGAHFLDLAPAICPRRVCQVVAWNLLTYRDRHHLTATFARAFADRLGAALGPLVRAPGPRATTRS